MFARSIGVSVINNTRCYSSQLDVFASDEIINTNKTVSCHYINENADIVIDTLFIGNTASSTGGIANYIHQYLLKFCYQYM